MAAIIKSRVKETSTATGTGTLAFAGAMTGFVAFSSVCANGDTFRYAIEAVDASGNPTGDWEVGLGTYTSSGNLLTRTTVEESSNANAAVNFSAGTKRIWLDISASQASAFVSSTVLNSAFTCTLGNNLVTSGGAVTITVTGTTNATLPLGTVNIGYLEVPQNSKSAAYTTVLADSGKSIDHPSTDANARTFTIDSNANVAYPVGTCISFSNMTSQVVTIAITTDTLYLAGTGSTGSRSLAQYGVATARKLTSTTWLISGVGLT